MNGYEIMGRTKSAPVTVVVRRPQTTRILEPTGATIFPAGGAAIQLGKRANKSPIVEISVAGGIVIPANLRANYPGMTFGRDSALVSYRLADGTAQSSVRVSRVVVYGGEIDRSTQHAVHGEAVGVVPPFQVLQQQNAGLPPGSVPPWYAMQYPAGYVPPLLISVDNPLETDPFDAFDEIRFRGERDRQDLERSHLLPGLNIPTYLNGYTILGVMEDNPLVVTPSFILDRMNRANAAMNTFQKDVWREFPGNDPFSLAFGAFKIEWDKFYQSNGAGASGWLSRLSGSTMDSVINYERRLDEWKQKFRDEVAHRGKSAGLSSPERRDPVTDPTNPQRRPDEKMPIWEKVLLGVGALAVGGTAIYLGSRAITR